MKILLDECITKRLKKHLPNHQVYSVLELNWNGIKNGELMTLCVQNCFDVLLTIDKNLQFQQNLDRFPVIIAVLNAKRSKIEELIKFLPAFEALIPNLNPQNAYAIEENGFTSC